MNPITALVHLFSFRDAQDERQSRQERARIAQEEAKLRHFNETGITPWNRPEATSEVTNTPYADMAAQYGFSTHKHHHRGEIILFDTRFEALSAPRRMIVMPLPKVVHADEKYLRRLMSRARFNLNRRAQRAGLLKKHPRRGKPRKEANEQD